MNINSFRKLRFHVALIALVALFVAHTSGASDRSLPPVNALGLRVRDSSGRQINYTRQELASKTQAPKQTDGQPARVTPIASSGFVPSPPETNRPFWNYAVFGSGIGTAGINIVPISIGGGPSEVIVNGYSTVGSFWQVLRYNATSARYDQLFVSRTYADSNIQRIALGNLIGDAQPEIAVMLGNGRVYLYDLATKAELGYIDTGVTGGFFFGANALVLKDLDGDGYAELILTTDNDLFVFDHNGSLLWQVAGAGGSDAVVGQMDNDPSLEIATTKGKVVDVATHAVQWDRSGGFGSHLQLAPLPGAGRSQLIAAEAWQFVYAYDVATQLPRWSISTPQDITALAVADVDGDGTPEVIIGDGQWGSLHVYDLTTQALEWERPNPEHGVTNIAVGDVDNDGQVDLLWGAGYTSSGSDYLYVAKTAGDHGIKWQSIDLEGPFLGPVIGDLDGDGLPELVFCSAYSESEYSSGRILVFDLRTMALRAISDPVIDNRAWEGVRDLKLRDLDGDGRMEILVAGDYLYDGTIEVYRFNPSNTFTRKWTNTNRPSGSPFNVVEAADLNGEGMQIITGNSYAHSGSEGIYVRVFDYPSDADPLRSLNLSQAGAVTGLVVRDLDGNGSKEIATLAQNGDLYTFDAASLSVTSLIPHSGATVIADWRTSPGLITGGADGIGHFLAYANDSYTESFNRQLGSSALDGIQVLLDGGLWTGSGGSINLRVPPEFDTVKWQSANIGSKTGRSVATDFQSGQSRAFTAAEHLVAGFNYNSPLPTPTPVPTSLGNISTRLHIGNGDNVLIGGFIVTGTQPKRVLIRAVGPSLPVAGALSDPVLELHGPTGLIATNDNWRDSLDADDIAALKLSPGNDLESAIIATLPANGTGYTAIVHGTNGATGVGVVEIYDLNRPVDSKLANISSRGFVQTGDDVMIGGFIVVGMGTQTVVIRAVGPSLSLLGKLADPTLEIYNRDGVVVASNDNWRSDQEGELIARGLAPSHDLESAIVATLPPTAHTAIVRGKNQTTGVALVEVYAVQ